jgi:hypothetical protein
MAIEKAYNNNIAPIIRVEKRILPNLVIIRVLFFFFCADFQRHKELFLIGNRKDAPTESENLDLIILWQKKDDTR